MYLAKSELQMERPLQRQHNSRMLSLGSLKNGMLVFFCFLVSLIKNVHLQRTANQLEIEMMRSRVIPDVIRLAPRHEVTVRYRNSTVDFGNKLYHDEIKNEPTVLHWPTEKNCLYTIVFTDPDVPTRNNPEDREYLHWAVANIPKNDIARGDCLAQYLGAIDEHLNSWHRYVFVVFEQKVREEFNDWMHLTRRPIKKYRAKFSTTHFASKYNLGDPIAANYFVCNNETRTTTTEFAPTTAVHMELGDADTMQLE